MRVRFASTVLGLRNVRSAMSRLLRPAPTRRAIVSSVGVRPVAAWRSGMRASSARARSRPDRRVEADERRERLVEGLAGQPLLLATAA
jgi:hypothetical protein